MILFYKFFNYRILKKVVDLPGIQGEPVVDDFQGLTFQLKSLIMSSRS